MTGPTRDATHPGTHPEQRGNPRGNAPGTQDSAAQLASSRAADPTSAVNSAATRQVGAAGVPAAPQRTSGLHLVPVRQRMAMECVQRWHRHNRPPVGDLFRVGVANVDGELVCVGIAGRPISREFDDGQTVEVTRVASDGTRNATSMAYAALSRAAFALGYRRVITYTQADETGSSLRAAGWRVIAQRPARSGWSMPSRHRDDALYKSTERTLWEA